MNICILGEAIKTITDDIDLRKSIFKTILQVWSDNGIWTNEGQAFETTNCIVIV